MALLALIRSAFAACAALALVPGLVAAADAPPDPAVVRAGPLSSREEWLPAQPLLTLPATSADGLGRGRTELRIDLEWGSDFGFEAGPGGRDQDLRYIVDGEHRSAAVTVRRGISPRLTLGVRLPIEWRGAGLLDDIIDPYHRTFGFPDSGRPLFPANRFRVEARDAEGRLRTETREGSGLGALELEGLWSLRERRRSTGLAAALGLRTLLPTGTGPFRRTRPDVSGQALIAQSLGRSGDLYFGLGLVRLGEAVTALPQATLRPHGFLAVEWRPARRVSLIAQADVAGRVVALGPEFPGTHGYLRLGVQFRARRGWAVDAGFAEGLHVLEATTDFGLLAGLSRRF